MYSTTNYQNEFCFCTLAIGKKYRLLAQELANDLNSFTSGINLIVYTDEPKDFSQNNNILAFKHRQQGILHCYNDKRLVMEMALSKFPAAIYIDADTRIQSQLEKNLTFKSGITAGHSENLITHASKYNPERLSHFKNIALKLNLVLDEVNYIGESLFIIARDGGKEIEFLKKWGIIGRYLELKVIHSGEGNAMGLAAAAVGWKIEKYNWQKIKDVTHHLDASSWVSKPQTLTQIKKRLAYHYRLNKSRILALEDFRFFYN